MLYRRTRRLRMDEVRLLQSLAEQVVLAVEQTFAMPGVRKKELARHVLRSLLDDYGIRASWQTVDIALEAAVQVMQLFEGSLLSC